MARERERLGQAALGHARAPPGAGAGQRHDRQAGGGRGQRRVEPAEQHRAADQTAPVLGNRRPGGGGVEHAVGIEGRAGREGAPPPENAVCRRHRTLRVLRDPRAVEAADGGVEQDAQPRHRVGAGERGLQRQGGQRARREQVAGAEPEQKLRVGIRQNPRRGRAAGRRVQHVVPHLRIALVQNRRHGPGQGGIRAGHRHDADPRPRTPVGQRPGAGRRVGAAPERPADDAVGGR